MEVSLASSAKIASNNSSEHVLPSWRFPLSRTGLSGPRNCHAHAITQFRIYHFSPPSHLISCLDYLRYLESRVASSWRERQLIAVPQQHRSQNPGLPPIAIFIAIAIGTRNTNRNRNVAFNSRFFCTLAENAGTETNKPYLEKSTPRWRGHFRILDSCHHQPPFNNPSKTPTQPNPRR